MPEISKPDLRRKFHRQQMQYPNVLLDELDPDAPVLLPDHLGQYDQIILRQLRSKGWPNTSSNGLPPRAAKGTSLAKKIAWKGNLSDQDITVLADRINWLQNNPFRWNMRDGYDAYFAAKSASGITPAAVDQQQPSDSAGSNGPSTDKARDVGPSGSNPGAEVTSRQVDDREPTGPRTDTRGAIREAFQAQSDHRSDRPGPIFISSDEPIPSISAFDPNPRAQAPGAEAARATKNDGDQVELYAPDYPDKPKTFGKQFPIPKARAFLMANARRDSIEDQLRLGQALIDDPDELAAALAHGEDARIDLLNAFGKLGLKPSV